MSSLRSWRERPLTKPCRVIYDALGLTGATDDQDTAEPLFGRNIVVEAEMVAYSEVLGRIDGTQMVPSLHALANASIPQSSGVSEV